MDWAKLALALVGLASTIVAWRRRAHALTDAQDRLIAQHAQALLLLTKWGQREAERLSVLSDQALDAEIDQLAAPKVPGAGP
jgi:hypothetical protein